MSAENGTSMPVDNPSKVAEAPIETKGKGKATATEEPVDETMDDDDDSSDDEVSVARSTTYLAYYRNRNREKKDPLLAHSLY